MTKSFKSSLFKINANSNLEYIGTDTTPVLMNLAESTNGTYVMLETVHIAEVEPIEETQQQNN